MPYSKGVNQTSWMPTRKWFAQLGGVLVALATEFLVSPTPDTPPLVWDNAEWSILSAGALALAASYLTRNQATPSGDGVPPA